MIVAYLRVSTEKQTLENQQNEISRFAKENNLTVDKWIAEVVSGKKDKSNRKLGMLLRRLKPNDTLIVTELSRLSRTLTEIMSIMGSLLKKKVRLYSTKDNYFFDDSINSKVLCFAFGLVAEIERNLIAARTREALELRKEQGVPLGRPKGSCSKLKNLIDSKKEIKYQLEQGKSINSLCKKIRCIFKYFLLFQTQIFKPGFKKALVFIGFP